MGCFTSARKAVSWIRTTVSPVTTVLPKVAWPSGMSAIRWASAASLM